MPDPGHWEVVVPKITKMWRTCILPELTSRWYTRKQHHGCHRSGNSQGKKKFFKIREKSGNFTLSQGKVKF